MLGYQLENKMLVKKSYKYSYHYARHFTQNNNLSMFIQ